MPKQPIFTILQILRAHNLAQQSRGAMTMRDCDIHSELEKILRDPNAKARLSKKPNN